MRIENIDPNIELRPLSAVAVERDADERGLLIAAAFTDDGRPVVLNLNLN